MGGRPQQDGLCGSSFRSHPLSPLPELTHLRQTFDRNFLIKISESKNPSEKHHSNGVYCVSIALVLICFYSSEDASARWLVSIFLSSTFCFYCLDACSNFRTIIFLLIFSPVLYHFHLHFNFHTLSPIYFLILITILKRLLTCFL